MVASAAVEVAEVSVEAGEEAVTETTVAAVDSEEDVTEADAAVVVAAVASPGLETGLAAIAATITLPGGTLVTSVKLRGLTEAVVAAADVAEAVAEDAVVAL